MRCETLRVLDHIDNELGRICCDQSIYARPGDAVGQPQMRLVTQHIHHAKHGRLLFATAVLGSMVLFGCSSQTPDSAPIPTPSASQAPQSDDEILKQQLDEAWERAKQRAPNLTDEDRPEVQQVRLITLDEHPQVIVGCLHEAGFPEVTAEDGAVNYSVADEAQGAALALAHYTCAAEYPLDPKFERPLTDEQLRKLYDHYTGRLRECVEAEGHEVSEPPTFEKFVEDQRNQSGTWDPISEASENLNGSQVQKLIDKCPEVPPDLYD